MPHTAAAGRADTITAGDCHAGGAALTPSALINNHIFRIFPAYTPPSPYK